MMKKTWKKLLSLTMVVLMVLVNTTALKAQETIDDNGISVLSLGEDGETIYCNSCIQRAG